MNRLSVAALLAALLACVGWTQGRIDASPEKKDLVAVNPFHELPPAQYMTEYVGTLLLGGMRAVAIDYLWIQFGKAEKERQYVEVDAILEILLKLQPAFPEIWNHLAWSKAYNISAHMESKEDRWRWVRSGIEVGDRAVKRLPASEKAWFHRGYLVYHRVPQEGFLLDEYRAETGRDAWEDAALWLEQAIEIAQSKGLKNTTPPSDGMMQDAYLQWAFAAAKRGEHERAIGILERGAASYARLVEFSAVTELNERTYRAFPKIAAIFALEEQALRIAAEPERRQALGKILEEYRKIEKECGLVKGAEERIVDLTSPDFERALSLAEQGKPEEASRFLEKHVRAVYEDLEAATAGGGAPFWAEMKRFVERVQNLLTKERDGNFSDALKIAEDTREDFRYNIPGGAPQWDALQRHADWLKTKVR